MAIALRFRPRPPRCDNRRLQLRARATPYGSPGRPDAILRCSKEGKVFVHSHPCQASFFTREAGDSSVAFEHYFRAYLLCFARAARVADRPGEVVLTASASPVIPARPRETLLERVLAEVAE